MSQVPKISMVVIGDTGVGKSCLLLQFVDRRFSAVHDLTIGVDFGSRIVEVGGERVKLQIWDTAGQERFQSLSNTFYRGADCCVIVFDLNNMKSYERITTWRNNFVES